MVSLAPLLLLLLAALLHPSAGVGRSGPLLAAGASSASAPPAAALAAQYAANDTWTEEGVVRLAVALQKAAGGQLAAACHGAACPPVVPCRSAAQLLAAGGAAAGGATQLRQLCPAVLQQGAAPGCLARLAQRPAKKPRARPRPAEVWGYGMLFVTVISLSSIFAVLLLPLLGRDRFERLMPGLIGLAVGSLASSALFHLIPQAFEIVVDGAGHGYLSTSLCVLAGAWFFFMIERVMKISLDYKKRRGGSVTDACKADGVYSSAAPRSASSCSSSTAGDIGCTLPVPATSEVKQSHQEPVRAMFGQVEQKPRTHHHHDHEVALTRGKGAVSEIAVVAWMVIFGDGFHNFLDGLSIGAAFSENILTGISISLAVLCEELPHELGDFAVLLDAGMTVRQAVVYNFLSACTCYLGLVLGILIGDFTESTSFVFALAAGMFLYISLVDMVPEMNEAAEKASGVSVLHGLRVLLVQNIGIMIGCFSLFALAYFADSISFD